MFSRKKLPPFVSHCCARPVLPLTVPIVPRSFDTLCCEKIKGSSTGEVIYASVNDVHLLLMQKDLESRYPLEYKNFVESIAGQSKPSTLVRSKLPKMSDKQLMSYIKSRHVQQPSELRGWYDFLSSQYQIELDAYKKALNDASDSSTPPAQAPAEPPAPAPADPVSK